MTSKEKQKLIDEMKKQGFPNEAVKKVLRGLQDEEEGRIFSVDEMYKRLYAKEKMVCTV